MPQVGDFVATDEPLFELYGGAVSIDDHRAARTAVAFGPERTMEQDPLFAFRIIADIALKALSPAINDPTTGVLALDQLHRLLRVVGRRRLRSDVDRRRHGHAARHLPDAELGGFRHRVVHRDPAYGAGNVQIARRLRAMLDNLVATLPARRHAALEAERRRLDLVVESLYTLPEDRELASVPDAAGAGRIVGVACIGSSVEHFHEHVVSAFRRTTHGPAEAAEAGHFVLMERALGGRCQVRRTETKGRRARASRTACSRSEASRGLTTYPIPPAACAASTSSASS